MRFLLLLWIFLAWGISDLSAQKLATRGNPRTKGKWTTYLVSNVKYVRVKDLMNFYEFKPIPHARRKGYATFGAKNRFVSFRSGNKNFYVNNFRYVLSFPVLSRGEDLLISATDVSKLIDPVLRPRFSKDAGKVTTVVIDPGHGGHDAGAVSRFGKEKDCNLSLALRLRTLLLQTGFKVVMTRNDDRFLTLGQRVEIANRYPNSIFISIHHNSAARASASGMETFTLAPVGTTSPFARRRLGHELEGNNQDSENVALATAIHSRCILSTKAVDRGIQRARFSVLCNIERPAILFEGGFLKHPVEGKNIFTASYQNKIAKSMSEGVIAYCKIVGGHAPKQLKTRSSYGSSIMGGKRNYSGRTRL